MKLNNQATNINDYFRGLLVVIVAFLFIPLLTQASVPLVVDGDINISDVGSSYKIGGSQILYASSTKFTTLVGFSAGTALLAASDYNTVVGHEALLTATTTNRNTAIGYQALRNSSTGFRNTAVGYGAIRSNTSGTYSTAVGYDTLRSNTTGSSNSAFGTEAMWTNTTGSSNTAMGYQAMQQNTTGSSNTAMGYGSAYSNTVGVRNTAIGQLALSFNATGSQNTALGYLAGRHLSNGVAVNSSPNQSVFIGNETKALGANDVNQIVIGYQAVGNGSDSVTLGNSNITKTILQGNIGIGTLAPDTKLTVKQSSNTSNGGFRLSSADNSDFRSQYMDASGTLSFYGGDTDGVLNTATLNTAGEWVNASDVSYKDNIHKLSYGLDTVLALEPRSYDIKNTNNHRIGFIAQEVETIIPEVVSGEEGSKGISYGNLVAVAISAIQELSKKVTNLKESISTKFLDANQIETQELCIGKTCVTEDQLIKLLEQSESPSVSAIPL